jgi:hypothetical protein
MGLTISPSLAIVICSQFFSQPNAWMSSTTMMSAKSIPMPRKCILAFDPGFERLGVAVVERVGSKEVPLPYSKSLEQYALPWAKDVVAAAKTTLA